MTNLFVTIFILSFIALPVLLIRPSLLARLTKRTPKRKNVVLIVFAILFLSFVGIGLTAPHVEMPKQSPETVSTPIATPKAVQTGAITTQPDEASPNPVTDQEQNNPAIPTTIPEAPTAVSAPTPTPAMSGTVTDNQYQYYPVGDVVDGDTLKITINGKETTLRLIGMDTPEVVDSRKPVQCFGKEASNKAKELLFGQKVRIEKDPSQGDLDKYGRALAYVYRSDGLFYNEYMIEQGYAHEYTYNVPYKYQAEFKAAQKDAQTNERGLWSPDNCNGDTEQAVNTSSDTAPIGSYSYYASSFRTAKYYYPSSCPAWQSLSPKYLQGFKTLAELLLVFPTYTLSPQCQ